MKISILLNVWENGYIYTIARKIDYTIELSLGEEI